MGLFMGWLWEDEMLIVKLGRCCERKKKIENRKMGRNVEKKDGEKYRKEKWKDI